MTLWLSSVVRGDNEDAIPKEWALLVLMMVGGAAVAFIVLWYTLLRHEETVLHRSRRKTVFRRGAPASAGGGTSAATGATGATAATAAANGHELDGGRDTAADLGLWHPEPEPGQEHSPDAEPDLGPESELETPPDAESAAAPDPDPAPETVPEPPLETVPEPESESESEPVPDSEPEPQPGSAVAAQALMNAADAADATVTAAASDGDAAGEPRQVVKGARKLTDEILSRIETEIEAREKCTWKHLASLVRHEYGVSVHPSSIQKAVKRRQSEPQYAESAEPASA